MADTSPQVRWVVLRHEGVADPHFDLMFETAPGSALRTYRIDRWPIDMAAGCTPLPDHRRQYLDYEGPISWNRGEVRRVAAGTCIFAELSGELCLHLSPAAVRLIISDSGTHIRPDACA